ncbi:unnamed protein product [Effrenium voratum]|uniref:Uncharacterized protein n=1 Tax=Effrenium voratum TaxID=2562239 RepID=A0AA36JJH4_9DINO|nr:unnamed protein product [Effrenium voratum]CAJ1431840.1 unnamed protein product [Effrenium voratum]
MFHALGGLPAPLATAQLQPPRAGGGLRAAPSSAGAAASTAEAGGFAAAAAAALGRRPKATQDSVFRWLGKVLRQRWGQEVLDAGTGPDSLGWLKRQTAEKAPAVTAVTACEGMYATMEDEVFQFLSPQDQVLLGNWQDESFLKDRTFDVVLADYLLGSVEHFAPYFQVGLLRRLVGLVKEEGLLVLVGKEPQEPGATASAEASRAAELVADAENFRDAVMVLGRQRSYREMPRAWVARQLWGLGLELLAGRRFPRKLSPEKVERNLAWAEEELAHVDNALRPDLVRHLARLRARLQHCPLSGLTFGRGAGR